MGKGARKRGIARRLSSCVFSLSHQFNHWVRVYLDALYNGLFKVVWETLSTFANKRHHLAGKQYLVIFTV